MRTRCPYQPIQKEPCQENKGLTIGKDSLYLFWIFGIKPGEEEQLRMLNDQDGNEYGKRFNSTST